MSDRSASRPLSPRVRTAASVLAAVGILLAFTVTGCAPEPPADGAPTVAEQEPAAPPSAEAPSDAGGGEPDGDEGAPSGDSDDEGTPDETDPVGADVDDEDPGTGGAGSGDTAGWKAPDDPAAEGPTAAPVLPEVSGRIGDGIALPTEVVVSLSSISTTTLTAETPGEQSGPAVVVEVQVRNESDEPQPVDSATVSLSAGAGEIGVPTWAAPNDPLHGEVPPGATADGTYVFMLDPADDRSVTVRVNYSAGKPVAAFTGMTP